MSQAEPPRLGAWLRELERAGVDVPRDVVVDLGRLLTEPELPRSEDARYDALLAELSQTVGVAGARAERLGDAQIASIVTLLVHGKGRAGAGKVTRTALAEQRLRILARADTLDVETLRLAATLGDRASFVDTLAALSSGALRAASRLSLSLLSRTGDHRVAPTARAHAANGYSGLARRGSIDALVPAELAWDDEELERRMLFDELSFYAREDVPEPAAHLTHVLVDVSASMRGDRATFARAVALSIGRAQLAKGEVVFRLFDARLSEPLRARGRALPVVELLSEKGERGRNTVRVLQTLADELAKIRAESGREQTTYLLTHGATDLPKPLLARIRESSRLVAILIAPRGAALVGYADAVDASVVVTSDDLRDPEAQAERGAAVVREVTG